MNLVEKIKLKLKDNDVRLYDEIIKNNITDKEILDNATVILKALEDKNNDELEYKLIIQIIDKKHLESVYAPFSPAAIKKEKVNLLSRNFLIPYIADEYYLLDGTKHVDWTKEKEGVLNWLKELGNSTNDFNGVWIYGKQGVGKTYMAMAILNKLVSLGKTGAFLPFSDFILRMHSSVLKIDEHVFDLIKPAKYADVLVIDDIGKEKITQWTRDSILVNILDYRIANKKLTIFTSNWSIDSYNEKLKIIFNNNYSYGNRNRNNKNQDNIEVDRITDRIYQLAPLSIEVKGRSYRHYKK
ncbi:MAG: AAA family ATPase [Mycoplasmataceae bacterium]|nr:AAA family ATPase [Mycoplasmataceae bacterium]